MKARFADTSFWFARLQPKDRHHDVARRIEPGPRIVTTEWVLGETWTLVNQWGNHVGAVSCLEAIRGLPGIEVEPVTPADLKAAWAWLGRHDERPYSFVDAVSFRVMQRRRLTEALAFDGDFSAAGFVEVRPPLPVTRSDGVAAENAEMRVVAREGALLAGGARAILLQVAHPAVGRGVAEHSDFAGRPLDRLRATLTYVYCVTFGTPEEIKAVAAQVTAAHRRVVGSGYRASDPELQLWVAATLYDTAVLLYDEVFGPLDAARADKVYAQYAVLGTALQVPAGLWPADRQAFRTYWDQTIDTLEVSDEARRVARDLLEAKHAPLPLRAAMPFNRFLTAAWLPDRIRAQYGISWDNGQQRRYDLLRKVGAPVYRLLPVQLREAPKTWYLRDMRKRLSAN